MVHCTRDRFVIAARRSADEERVIRRSSLLNVLAKASDRGAAAEQNAVAAIAGLAQEPLHAPSAFAPLPLASTR